jgi:hypothetical protein
LGTGWRVDRASRPLFQGARKGEGREVKVDGNIRKKGEMETIT